MSFCCNTGLWSLTLSCSVLEERARDQPTCRILPLPWIVLKPGKDSCSCHVPGALSQFTGRLAYLSLGDLHVFFVFSSVYCRLFYPPCFSIAMYTLTVDGLFFGWFLLKLIEHLADRQLSRPCRVCFMT